MSIYYSDQEMINIYFIYNYVDKNVQFLCGKISSLQEKNVKHGAHMELEIKKNNIC